MPLTHHLSEVIFQVNFLKFPFMQLFYMTQSLYMQLSYLFDFFYPYICKLEW